MVIFSRSLQVLGLLVVPLGLFWGIELGSMALELLALVGGTALFALGRKLDTQ